MFNWLNVSMTRKISSLSFILLSFLFVVILYSAYQSQKIHKEMQEVAEIDIPLTEVIANIEIVQLKQHLLMESIRLQGAVLFDNERLKKQTLEGFFDFNKQLSSQLDKVMEILRTGLTFGSIRIQIESHQALVKQVSALHSHRVAFERLASDFFQKREQGFDISWAELEKQDRLLDNQAYELLNHIDKLTLSVVALVEEQELHFMVVNAVLGLSALLIGLYLTLYIIQSFSSKIRSLRGQIDTLHRSIDSEENSDDGKHYHDLDEFVGLEQDLKNLIGKLSVEMENRYEVESHLLELATRDKLTGAYNRHKWDDQIEEELRLANRGYHFSIILLDLDYFKKINDAYGHDVGDSVLKILTRELQKRIRSTDMLFRIGGEEFIVLLKDTDAQGAYLLADLLRLKIDELEQPHLPSFTISLGVTGYQEGDDANTIVKRADVLLYEAKGAGRNQVMKG